MFFSSKFIRKNFCCQQRICFLKKKKPKKKTEFTRTTPYIVFSSLPLFCSGNRFSKKRCLKEMSNFPLPGGDDKNVREGRKNI